MVILLAAFILFYPSQGSSTKEQIFTRGNPKNPENETKVNKIVDYNETSIASMFRLKESVGNTTINSKPMYMRVDNESKIINFSFPMLENKSLISCNSIFKCTSSSSTGWKDGTSFKISTNTTNKTWSSIYGKEIDVKKNKAFKLVAHMKINKWATESHVVLEGFNKTAKHWNQIKYCSPLTDAPLEWQEYSCIYTVPDKITKIRPVLNAGWSSQPGKEATTWYDSVYVIDLGKTFVIDPNLKIELVASGLKEPTTMAFLGANEILVLQKDNGTVRKIIDGKVLPKPLIDVPVATSNERGMLGIAVSRNEFNNRTYVFLYFTEAATGRDGDDVATKTDPLGNRLYRYEYINGNLVNPKLLLDLPASPADYHNGGVLTSSTEKQIVYLVVGDVNHITKAVNNKTGAEPDGSSGILRLTFEGKPVNPGIIGDTYPQNLYYAYGLRNSFGIAFDPVTGNLWDTENGPDFGDEINLVEPGFDSGWRMVQGVWTVDGGEKKGHLALQDPTNLVNFGERGKYSSPEFTWNHTVGPTALKFLTTDKLGKEYENDMFVADSNNGRIYHFKLNHNRTALSLQGPLKDKIADSSDELDNIIFAQGFGDTISDLQVGPDGYLYLVSHYIGKIYRIVPQHLNE